MQRIRDQSNSQREVKRSEKERKLPQISVFLVNRGAARRDGPTQSPDNEAERAKRDMNGERTEGARTGQRKRGGNSSDT